MDNWLQEHHRALKNGDVAASAIVGHGIYVLVAFPVAPFVVAVNVMLLVVIFMCLACAMALVFTICASVAIYPKLCSKR